MGGHGARGVNEGRVSVGVGRSMEGGCEEGHRALKTAEDSLLFLKENWCLGDHCNKLHVCLLLP